MKSLFKNKKVIIAIVIILLLVIGGVMVLLFGNHKSEMKEDKVLKEETFTAYVKINPLVKLTFHATYYECTEDDKTSICGEYTNEVVSADLLNDDAQSIYTDLELEGLNLNDAIALLAKTAYDNEYNIENITITSDWNYDIDNINKSITEKIKTDTLLEIEITFNYQEVIDESTLLENEDVNVYTVSFNSDGGTNVAKQSVVENKTVTKPSNPTKEGYTFIEWQLNGKTYDFDTPVEEDITLKAKWKKDSSNKTNTSTNNESKTDNSSTTQSNATNTPTQTSTKEQDNATLRKQLQAKGLQWDFDTEEEAKAVSYRWLERGGYDSRVEANNYGESDTAYSVIVTLNAAACGSNKVLTIDWRHETAAMQDFIYYLHSLGYNCSGSNGYYNGKYFTINENNELVFQ